MLKLSNLYQNTSAIAAAAAPAEFAMHALSRDANGLLTYTKVLWANTAESVNITNMTGKGFAYNGMEEFINGYTLSDAMHNLDKISTNQVGEKTVIANTFLVRVTSVGGNTQYTMNNETSPVLYLTKGSTYKFVTEDKSTISHPIFISTTPAGGSYTNEYLYGVEYSRSANVSTLTPDANTSTSNPLTFTVPVDAPKQLYYASGNDAGCFGIIRMEEALTNTANRKYEQVRFDNQQLNYYINSQGFLVARYGADYSYT
jgi:hypothetical protein